MICSRVANEKYKPKLELFQSHESKEIKAIMEENWFEHFINYTK